MRSSAVGWVCSVSQMLGDGMVVQEGMRFEEVVQSSAEEHRRARRCGVSGGKRSSDGPASIDRHAAIPINSAGIA